MEKFLQDKLQQLLQTYFSDKNLIIRSAQPLNMAAENDKFNEKVRQEKYAADDENMFLGLHPYKVQFEHKQQHNELFLMIKGFSDKGVDARMLPNVLNQANIRLSKPISYYAWGKEFGFTTWQEIYFYQLQKNFPLLADYTPKYYGHIENETKTNFVLVEEYLNDVVLINEDNNPALWQESVLIKAIEGLAAIHSISYANNSLPHFDFWLTTVTTSTSMIKSEELWKKMAEFIRKHYPTIISEEDYKFHLHLIQTLGDWYNKLTSLPHCLIQNDFNPRNICFKTINNQLKLCAYDWDRAELGLPQHDLAEFLTFTLTDDLADNQIFSLIDLHRNLLADHTKKLIDKNSWKEGVILCLYDLYLNRVPFLLLFSFVIPSQFALRLFPNLKRLIGLLTSS